MVAQKKDFETPNSRLNVKQSKEGKQATTIHVGI